jgi:hypothetical protein
VCSLCCQLWKLTHRHQRYHSVGVNELWEAGSHKGSTTPRSRQLPTAENNVSSMPYIHPKSAEGLIPSSSSQHPQRSYFCRSMTSHRGNKGKGRTVWALLVFHWSKKSHNVGQSSSGLELTWFSPFLTRRSQEHLQGGAECTFMR